MVKDFTLTLNGSAQRLSSVLSDTTPGGAQDLAYRSLMFSADPANANAIFIGGTSSVSTSAYGAQVVKPTSNIPAAPIHFSFSHAGPMKLSEFWVIGTNAEKLHILGIPF